MHSPPNALRAAAAPQASLIAQHPGYLVAGAGTPVVMLHASLGSKAQWTSLAERLAPRFRAIALDLCGYGDNPLPGSAGSFSLDEEVRLVTARVDRLVGPHIRVHVVGHSYGGLVALRFAQRSGGRVASLTLYEPVVFRALDDDDATLAGARRLAETVSRLIAEGRRHDAARLFVDFWSGDGSYASLPLPAQTALARRIDKVPLDFQAAWGWRPDPSELRAIVAPTLLLGGKRSPEVAQRIHTRLSGALANYRVGWFDCGHMGPVTDANRVNPWVEAFVDICAVRDASLAAPRAVSPTARSVNQDEIRNGTGDGP